MLVRMLNLKNAQSAKHRIWMGLAKQGEHSLICPSSLVSACWYRIAPMPLASSTMLMNMQRPACAPLEQQQIFLMGSIIARSLESALLLEIKL